MPYQRAIPVQQSETEILTTEASRLVQVTSSHEQIQEPERPIPIPDSGQSILLTEEEIERIEEERIRNVVKLTATDQLNSEIITNRTRGKKQSTNKAENNESSTNAIKTSLPLSVAVARY